MKAFSNLLKGFQSKSTATPNQAPSPSSLSLKPWNYICINGFKRAIQYLDKNITNSNELFALRSVSTSGIEELIQKNNLSDNFLGSLDNLYDLGLAIRLFLESHEPMIPYNLYEEFVAPNVNYEKLLAVLSPLNDNILETFLNFLVKILTATLPPQYKITSQELIDNIGVLLLRNKDEDNQSVPTTPQELLLRKETIYKLLSFHAKKTLQASIPPLQPASSTQAGMQTPQKVNTSNTSSIGNLTMFHPTQEALDAIPMQDRSIKIVFVDPEDKPDKETLTKMLATYGAVVNVALKEKIAVVLYELPQSAIQAAEENAFASDFKVKYLGKLTMDDLHASHLYVPVTPLKGISNNHHNPSMGKEDTLPPHPATPSQLPAAINTQVGIAAMARGSTHTISSNTTPVISIAPIQTMNDEVMSVTSVATGGESSGPTTPTNKVAMTVNTNMTPKTTTKRNVTVEEHPPTLHGHQTPQKSSTTGTTTVPGTEKKGKGPATTTTTTTTNGHGEGTSGLGMSSLDMSAISKVYEDDQDQQHYLSKFSLLRPDITTIQTATGTTPHHVRSTPHHPTILEEDEEEEEEKTGNGDGRKTNTEQRDSTLRHIAQRMLTDASRNSSFISDSSESLSSMTAVHNGRTSGNTLGNMVGGNKTTTGEDMGIGSSTNTHTTNNINTVREDTSSGSGWKSASGGSGKKDIYHRSPTRNTTDATMMVDTTSDTIVTIHPNMLSNATTPYKDAAMVVVLEQEEGGRSSTPPLASTTTTSSAGTLSPRGDDSSTASPNSSLKKRTLKTIKVMTSPTNSSHTNTTHSPGHSSGHNSSPGHSSSGQSLGHSSGQSPASRSTLGHHRSSSNSEGSHPSSTTSSSSLSPKHTQTAAATVVQGKKSLSIQTHYGAVSGEDSGSEDTDDSEGSVPPYGMILPVSSEPPESIVYPVPVAHTYTKHVPTTTTGTSSTTNYLKQDAREGGDVIAAAKEAYKRAVAMEKHKYDALLHQPHSQPQQPHDEYAPQPPLISSSESHLPSKSHLKHHNSDDDFAHQLAALQSLLHTTQQHVQSLQHTLHQQDTTYQQSLFSYQIQILSLTDEKERLVQELTALKCDFAQLKTKQVVQTLKSQQQSQQQAQQQGQLTLGKTTSSSSSTSSTSSALTGKSQREVMQLYLHQQSLIALLQEENTLRTQQVEAGQSRYEELVKEWEGMMSEKVWYEQAYHTATGHTAGHTAGHSKTHGMDMPPAYGRQHRGHTGKAEEETMLAQTPPIPSSSYTQRNIPKAVVEEVVEVVEDEEEEEDMNASRLISPTLPSPLRTTTNTSTTNTISTTGTHTNNNTTSNTGTTTNTTSTTGNTTGIHTTSATGNTTGTGTRIAHTMSIEEVEDIPLHQPHPPPLPIISSTTTAPEHEHGNENGKEEMVVELPLFKRYLPSSASGNGGNGIRDTDIHILQELIEKQSQSYFGKDTAKLLSTFTSAHLPTSQSLSSTSSSSSSSNTGNTSSSGSTGNSGIGSTGIHPTTIRSSIPYPDTTSHTTSYTTSLPLSTTNTTSDPLALYTQRINSFVPINTLQYNTGNTTNHTGKSTTGNTGNNTTSNTGNHTISHTGNTTSHTGTTTSYTGTSTSHTGTTTSSYSYSDSILAKLPPFKSRVQSQAYHTQGGEGAYTSQRLHWTQQHHHHHDTGMDTGKDSYGNYDTGSNGSYGTGNSGTGNNVTGIGGNGSYGTGIGGNGSYGTGMDTGNGSYGTGSSGNGNSGTGNNVTGIGGTRTGKYSGYSYDTIQSRSAENMQHLGNYLHSLHTGNTTTTTPSSSCHPATMEYYPHHRVPLHSPMHVPLPDTTTTHLGGGGRIPTSRVGNGNGTSGNGNTGNGNGNGLFQAVQSIALPALSMDPNTVNTGIGGTAYGTHAAGDVPSMASMSQHLQRLTGTSNSSTNNSNNSNNSNNNSNSNTQQLWGTSTATTMSSLNTPATLAFQARMMSL